MKNNFLDVLMVFPSGGDLYFTNFKHHLGSAYVITYLRDHSFNAEQFISDESCNVNECIKKIANSHPHIVGFTVYETNFMQCALISNGLKAYNSDIIIIFGGPTPSVQSKEVLEGVSSVDICVRREGEETLLELILNLSKNNFKLNQVNLFSIKGITFRKGNKIIINPERNDLLSNKSIKNYIDKFPSPYLSKVIPISRAFPTGIITARGCNQNCTYCNCAVMSKKNIFFHSIERVIEELVYINECKKFLGPVPINDDSFTILPTRTFKICESMIENDIKIPLICTTRCDKITEELLDLMKQAGFVSIGFSLESAVPRILKTIGKVSPPNNINSEKLEKEIEFIEKLKHMTSYAKKIGFNKVFVSIMVGLPGETIQDALKTIDFINQLDIDFYTHNFFHIFRGTPIFQNYKRFGYKIKPMGDKNKILIKNDFPFDVYKIKLAPKCAKIQNNEVIDYDVLKILSLSPKRTMQKSFFDNVIINSDSIKPPLVKWIQENLAINGAIIHIYSDKSKYLKFHEKNEKTLYNEFSPTSFYECYCWENSVNNSILKSGRMTLYDDQIGMPIRFKDTKLALNDYKNGEDNMKNLISIEHSPIDTIALCNFLIDLFNNKDIINYLLNSYPLPEFQQLCRWTKNQANCETLDTAIIENDDSIRICWFSDSIGNIRLSFSDLIQNLENLKKEREKTRNCRQCKVNEKCIKCIFPFPLSTERYCEYKRYYYTNKPAKLINAFGVVKDFLFKPINPLEF
ncbi:MAG: radical SAM protein [Candidatus Lokiarchaeota archaeon]|nr:radical SAM protein [Candidatus Lokiarchaeota archaeon]